MAEDPMDRLGEAWSLGADARRRRMLIVVNPRATTVSERLRHLVVIALQGRYEVTAVDTQAQGHATELCRAAVADGYDVVVAFGGDGTVNEVANGIAGAAPGDRPALTCLPGGATNVYCRILGIPNDIVDATENLLRMADAWPTRSVDLAHVNGRYFTFSSGAGLDASVVERVDAHPRLKSRFGAWYFGWVAIATFVRRYLVRPPRMLVDVPGREPIAGVTALVQNAELYTYFRRWPLHAADGGRLDDGSLGGVVLRRSTATVIPGVVFRLLSPRAQLPRHRAVEGFTGVDGLAIRSADGRPIPLQVDGDYIGDVLEARYGVAHGALTVVA